MRLMTFVFGLFILQLGALAFAEGDGPNSTKVEAIHEPSVSLDELGADAGTEESYDIDLKSRELQSKDTWDSVPKDHEAFESTELSSGIRVEEIIEPPSDYSYASFGKSDPFLPSYELFVSKGPSSADKQFEIPIVSPLQVPNIERNLSVVGLWELPNGEKRALIIVRTSRRRQGVIAKVGDPIGLLGKITEIDEAGVTAREYTILQDGSRTFEDKKLLLKEADDDGLIGGKVVLQPGREPKVIEKSEIEQSILSEIGFEEARNSYLNALAKWESLKNSEDLDEREKAREEYEQSLEAYKKARNLKKKSEDEGRTNVNPN